MNDPMILQDFLELSRISAPSHYEGEIRAVLEKKLRALGLRTRMDDAFPETGSGNLYGYLPGRGEPLAFSVHMDTVAPCDGRKVICENSGLLHTDGKTVLGGDDLTGVCEVLAALRKITAENLPHRPLEILCTASEEYFVQGAERLRYDWITAKEAYVPDTDGEIGRAVCAAPTGIRILADITGRASHAALAPEDGINAVQAAAVAIAAMPLGRIDADTTANIGIIRGGESGNIVPGTCFVEGETRSLTHESALRQAGVMAAALKTAAENIGAVADVKTNIVYPAWHVAEDTPIARRFADACGKAGLTAVFESACGGSDASFLSTHGITCLVVASGMHEIHSVREWTTLSEMETMADVICTLMQG